MKHRGGSIMVLGCLAASGPGCVASIDRTTNSGLCQQILQVQENVRASFCELKRRRKWVMQQDNNPKHTSKSTTESLKQKRFCILEWPSQSPDLNPIEMLRQNLKRGIRGRKPTNISELKQFCEEEWAKFPQSWCAGLIKSYRECLVEVIAAPRRSHQWLNVKVHILYPTKKLNVGSFCSISRFFFVRYLFNRVLIIYY